MSFNTSLELLGLSKLLLVSQGNTSSTSMTQQIFRENFYLHILRRKMEVLWVGQQQRSRDKTGREETEPTRQLYMPGWSGLQGRWHGDSIHRRIQAGVNT